MLNLHVTVKHRLDRFPIETTVTAKSTFPRDIREALADQYHQSLRHVDIVKVVILGRTAEENGEIL